MNLPRQFEAELFLRDRCGLGEGPFWFDDKLWWVDIEAGSLLAADANGVIIERWSVGEKVGAAAPIGRATFLVALEAGLSRFDLATRQCVQVAALDQRTPDIRFNDGKCDPAGRFLAGTLSMHGVRGTSALYVLERDRPLRLLRDGLSTSNGMAWSEDGRTFYHIDTPDRCVMAFKYDVKTGSLSDEDVVLRFREADGFPDGMTIDREGRLWISFWDGGAVRCYRPESAACEVEVRVPCSRPTSCCFGGPGLDRLFITSARTGLSEEQLAQQPLAGSVFVCNVGASGWPTAIFR